MRVNKQSYAKRIKATLRDWDVVCDREEAIDCIIYNFSRLHGIGVAVKETEISNEYTFMSYPNRIEDHWHPLDTGYEESTCISVTMTVIKRQIEKDILKTVEKKLNLPHWEDYLEEKPKDKEPTAKDFVELGKAIGEGMAAGLKHDDRVDALSYGLHFYRTDAGKDSFEAKISRYCEADVKATTNAYKRMLNQIYGTSAFNNSSIDKVVFNDPATIVFWKDGTKTVVKAQDGEAYDPEKGLAMAICKKTMGNTRDYYNVFLKYLKQWKKENPEKETVDVFDATGKQLVSFDFNPDEEVEIHAAFRQFADAHELRMWRHNDLLPYDYSYKFAQGDGKNEKTYTILVNSICITRRELNDHLLALAQYFHL